MRDIEELVDEGDWWELYEQLQAMADGDARDEALDGLMEALTRAKHEPFEPDAYVIFAVEDRGGASDRWWDTLSFAALGREAQGVPVVALNVDPYAGDRPARARCLVLKSDLAFWEDQARELALEARSEAIVDGAVLVDLIGGVGRAELILRGRSDGPPWSRWTIVLS